MDEITEAVSVLRRDGIIVYPTETVYGLGGDAFSDEAIQRVYEIKERPLSKPVSVAVSDMDMLHAIAFTNEASEEFINRFLPGPVTVVLRAKSCVPPVLTGGTGLIGIRMPDNKTACEIIRQFDAPITSTSANTSGQMAPVRKEDVTVIHDLFVDGGDLPGTPSTVIDLVNWRIIRAGADIEEIGKYLASMD